MEVLIYACLLMFIPFTYGSNDTQTKFTNSNPLDFPDDDTFFPGIGGIADLYQTDKEVTNLIAPMSGCATDDCLVDFNKHPPIYFNLNENGKNLGQYVLIKKNVHKINDGRDATADNLDIDETTEPMDKSVYIGSSDGIYVYNPETRDVEKYGDITEDILAIDKVLRKDEIYILASDHKIYKVTEGGSVKTLVEGIEYANDFVLDFLEGIFYTDENNKPHLLVKGETVPKGYPELDFKIVKPILARPTWAHWDIKTRHHAVPLVIDGVPYDLTAEHASPSHGTSRVPGLTAFNAEIIWACHFAVNGTIYQQSLLADEAPYPEIRQASKTKNSPKKVGGHDLRASYESFKKKRN